MLPIKAKQLNYQEFGRLVWNHFEKIIKYEQDNDIKFDVVLAKLRNGVVPGSIIATHFGLELATINAPRFKLSNEYETFFSKNILEKMKNKKLNVLFVDSICGTGETIGEVKKHLAHNFDNINLVSYCTLVDEKAKLKPDIIGLIDKDFFQPPWEWRSFTPQSHLERLEFNHIKAAEEVGYYFGFSSSQVKSDFDSVFDKKVGNSDWFEIFETEKTQLIQSTSGISSLQIKEDYSLNDLQGKYAELIRKKIDFVNSYGFTHFVEDNVNIALLLSKSCPVTHFLIIQNKELYRVILEPETLLG